MWADTANAALGCRLAVLVLACISQRKSINNLHCICEGRLACRSGWWLCITVPTQTCLTYPCLHLPHRINMPLSLRAHTVSRTFWVFAGIRHTGNDNGGDVETMPVLQLFVQSRFCATA